MIPNILEKQFNKINYKDRKSYKRKGGTYKTYEFPPRNKHENTEDVAA